MRCASWRRAFCGVVTGAVAVVACGDDPAEPPFDPRVPVAAGNRWEYTGGFFVVLRPDSVALGADSTFLDERTGSSVRVSGPAVLADTILVSAWVDSLVTRAPGRAREVYTATKFYADRPNGLWLHGYAGSTLLPPKPAPRLRVGGREFAGPRALRALLFDSFGLAAADTIVEMRPRLDIRYPLVVGTQWIYRQAGDPWRIDKRVAGVETADVPAGSFRCAHIRWLHDLDGDGSWDEDVRIDDWVGSSGIVRREVRATGEWIGEDRQRRGVFESLEWYALVRFTPGPALP